MTASLSESKSSRLRARQTLRYRYLRKLRHFADGFFSFDLGLWRRFEQAPLVAVAGDFRVISIALRQQMESFRLLHAEYDLPKPIPADPQQLQLVPLPLAEWRKTSPGPAMPNERKPAHAR
jgi:hypothetical protein